MKSGMAAMITRNIWMFKFVQGANKLSSTCTAPFFLSCKKRAANALALSSKAETQQNEQALPLSLVHTNSQTSFQANKSNNWKHMCLYYTQNKCTKMDDPQHLERFSHCYSSRLEVGIDELKNLQPQQFDYFLVLDLEGKIEILEFPVLMIDARTLEFVDAFHRFVRPVKMSEKRIEEYIEGKYGKQGLDRVWHDTAIPFGDVVHEFEMWLRHHNLWENGDSTLHRAAFVTCGNWDVKTKIPQQCQLSGLHLPPYFMEWINMKDVYLNFYKYRAAGMVAMLKGLSMPIIGTHHVGLDDAQNIARVLQRMLLDGALMQVTARRTAAGPSGVKFLFKNRIK